MSRPLFLPLSINLYRMDLDAYWAGRPPRGGDLEDGDPLPSAPSSEPCGEVPAQPMPDLTPGLPPLPRPERQRPPLLIRVRDRVRSLLRPGAILSRRLLGS